MTADPQRGGAISFMPAGGPPPPAGAAPSQAERGAAPLSLGLDRRRRLGEGRAVGGAGL